MEQQISEKVMNKLSAGRTYRDMQVGAQEEDKIVEGYASTFNDPYFLFKDDGVEVWERIDPKAFDNCDMSDVIMQYDHEGRVFARKSNNTLMVDPDDKGLFMRAILGGTEIGRQLYEEIKGGYTNKMSFGFTVASDVREVSEDKTTGLVKVLRTITSISKLYDVSAVSLPANDATSISARNYGEGVIAEVKQEMLKAQEELEARKQTIAKIKLLSEV